MLLLTKWKIRSEEETKEITLGHTGKSVKTNGSQACLIHQTTVFVSIHYNTEHSVPYLNFFAKLNQWLMTINAVAFLFHNQDNTRYFNELVKLIRQSRNCVGSVSLVSTIQLVYQQLLASILQGIHPGVYPKLKCYLKNILSSDCKAVFPVSINFSGTKRINKYLWCFKDYWEISIISWFQRSGAGFHVAGIHTMHVLLLFAFSLSKVIKMISQENVKPKSSHFSTKWKREKQPLEKKLEKVTEG